MGAVLASPLPLAAIKEPHHPEIPIASRSFAPVVRHDEENEEGEREGAKRQNNEANLLGQPCPMKNGDGIEPDEHRKEDEPEDQCRPSESHIPPRPCDEKVRLLAIPF